MRPFDNVAAESDFQPARLKPVVWEDTEQDKEEFVEIPLLDIDFSAGDGCYEIVDREEFSLIFRRYYLHKMGVAVNAARIIRISGSSMEPRLQDGDVVGINTDDTRIREGKTYAIRHGNLLRVKVLIEQPDGGVIIRSQPGRIPGRAPQLSAAQRATGGARPRLLVLFVLVAKQPRAPAAPGGYLKSTTICCWIDSPRVDCTQPAM